jgi:WD40 repeat protein
MSAASGFAEVVTVQADAELTVAAVLPRGHQCVCGSSSGDVLVADMVSGALNLLFSSDGPRSSRLTGGVVAIRPSHSGLSVFVASRGGTIVCIDVSTGILTLELGLPSPCSLTSFAVCPSGFSMAASYANNSIRLWDVISGELLPVRLTAPSVDSLANSLFLTENVVAASSGDGKVYFWDLAPVRHSSASRGAARDAAVVTLQPVSAVTVASGTAEPQLSGLACFDAQHRLVTTTLSGVVAILGP